MPVDATSNTDALTVNPTKIRYGLNLSVEPGKTFASLMLQRSDKRKDETWLDDPRPDSRKSVPVPEDLDLSVITAIVPTLAEKLGLADYSKYRVTLQSKLDNAGVLDVQITMQALTSKGWRAGASGLTALLTANPDIAATVMGAWAALDKAVNAANAANKWL